MYTTSLSNISHLKLLTTARYYMCLIKSYMKKITANLLLKKYTLTQPMIAVINPFHQYIRKITTISNLLSQLIMSMVMMDAILPMLYWGICTWVLIYTEYLHIKCYNQIERKNYLQIYLIKLLQQTCFCY